jgi:hypothetical protein
MLLERFYERYTVVVVLCDVGDEILLFFGSRSVDPRFARLIFVTPDAR